MRIDEAREAGAVESGARRGAAVRVADADERAGVLDDLRLLPRNRGGVADARLGAEGATGTRRDQRDEDEKEQRKANAFGHTKGLPSAEAARKSSSARLAVVCGRSGAAPRGPGHHPSEG